MLRLAARSLCGRLAPRVLPAAALLLLATLSPLPAAGGPRASDEAPLVPMEDFFRNPQMSSFFVSPDGEYVSYLAPWEGRLNVHVRRADGTEVTRVTSLTDRDVVWYFWGGKSRIIYMQDGAGDENWLMYAVDPDGSNPKDLTPFENVQVQPIDSLPEIDDQVIVAMNHRDPRVHDVYRVNIVTGEIDLIAENPGDIVGWDTDHDGKLRVAVASNGADLTLRYRESEDVPFRDVLTLPFTESMDPQSFTYDNERLYVASNVGRDKSAIFEYDPSTGELLDLIYEHPEVDVENIVLSRSKQALVGVYYYTDRGHYVFFDDEARAMYEDLKQKLPGYDVMLVSSDLAEIHWTVKAFNDRSRGVYYSYNRKTGRLDKLADVAPWIREDQMAECRPVEYQARDGLTIHGYLTLPKGAEAKDLPTVLLVHGGPWARDHWGFNPEAQFLANRGYAVLQVNFRGSTGYGKHFWTSSFKEWGRAMQDDLTDGVKWLVKKGIADPERVCIYGGSYGGYATLAGVTLTPDLYTCAIDYCGVPDLITFIDTFPPYWEKLKGMWISMVGDPVADKEMLEEVSPAYHYDRIRVPMLVVQGGNDVRVPKEISDKLVAGLEEKGIDVEYLFRQNEGHGFLSEENQFAFYRAMEEFLGKHLGGRIEETAG